MFVDGLGASRSGMEVSPGCSLFLRGDYVSDNDATAFGTFHTLNNKAQFPYCSYGLQITVTIY